MSKINCVTVIPHAGSQRELPTLSVTLESWLRERLTGAFPDGTLQDIDFTEENFIKIGAVFLRAAEFETAGRVAQGYCLTRMVAMSETSMRAFLAEHGVSTGTAYRLMADFGLFNSGLTLDQIRRLSEIEFTKRPLLAQIAGKDGLPQLLDGCTVNGLNFDGAKAKTQRDLEQMFKEQRENDIRIKKYKDRAVLAEEQCAALQHQLERALSGPELPAWCATMRGEAALQGEALNQIFDQLREVFFECVVDAHEPKNADTLARLQQMAAGTLYRTVFAFAARASAFSVEIKNHFGDEIALGDSPDEILTPKEIDALDGRRRAVIDLAQAAFEQRKLDRLNEAKTGRGRKLTKLSKKPGPVGRPRKTR